MEHKAYIMKIILKNFRHHRDDTFEFPDEGLILLSGERGSGKSTIFKGIVYALYGCVRKPYSHGTTTCQVILEFRDMIITRTNRPNRVVVQYQDSDYEDDAAQGLIDSIIGTNFQEFSASSYVVQRSQNSIVSMTPSEQVKFVEKIAFNDNDHINCREKIKNETKRCKALLSQTEGKICAVEEQIERVESDLPANPIDSSVDFEEIKKTYECTLKDMQEKKVIFEKLVEEREKLQKMEDENKNLSEQKKKLDIEINQFSSLRSNIGRVLEDEEIENLETKLEKSKLCLYQTKTFYEVQSIEKKIEKYREIERTRLKDQIAEMRNSLPSSEELAHLEQNVSNIENTRQKYESEAREIETIQKLHDESTAIIKKNLALSKKIFREDKRISRIKKCESLVNFLKSKLNVAEKGVKKSQLQIKNLESKLSRQEILGKLYECPNCSTTLSFTNEKLREVTKDDNVDEDVDDYEIQLLSSKMQLVSDEARIIKISQMLEELNFSMANLKEKIPEHTVNFDHRSAIDMEKRFAIYQHTREDLGKLELKKPEDSSAIVDLLKEMKILSKGYPKKFQPSEKIEDVNEKISSLTKELEDAWKNKSEYSSLSREITSRKRKIDLINNRIPKKKLVPSKNRTIQSISEEINSLQKHVMFLTEELQGLTEKMKNISKYEIYKSQLVSLEELRGQCSNYKVEHREIQRSLEGALGLEVAGKEAEILAMEKTIESINEHAKNYLDQFFDDPINVRLEISKANAKGVVKTQMNTMIQYRGSTYDPSDDPSGGEMQGIELAFLLGVNDMLGSSILLLDECINNLDAENNTNTLSCLRSISNNKLVIVISHEAIKGIFDKVLYLGKQPE